MFGGGCETAVNCDLVIAADTATFGLVEVKRGVAPYAGVLPRLIRTLGLQRASEMALTGKVYTAAQMEAWGVVNKVVPRKDVVAEAVAFAKLIAENSLIEGKKREADLNGILIALLRITKAETTVMTYDNDLDDCICRLSMRHALRYGNDRHDYF